MTQLPPCSQDQNNAIHLIKITKKFTHNDPDHPYLKFGFFQQQKNYFVKSMNHKVHKCESNLFWLGHFVTSFLKNQKSVSEQSKKNYKHCLFF